jgi:heme A synthase
MTSETENGISWLHRLGTLVAVMTFLLYMTGVLASNTGSSLFMPHTGNKGDSSAASPDKYAHAFVILAITVSALTIILAVWLWKSSSRRYLKNLGVVTVGVLFAMALAALSPARNLFPTAASVGYTFGIQIFFCLTVCLALFTRTDWRWDEPKAPDLASPSMRQVLIFTTAAVFIQPFLGKGFREKAVGIAPHLVLGIAVVICSLWVLEMALTKFSHLRAFKISAVFLAEVVGLQLFFGIISYSMNLTARAVPGPQPGLTVMNVTHAAVGALVLATSFFVTCQGFKYFAPAGSEVSSAMFGDYQQPERQDD